MGTFILGCIVAWAVYAFSSYLWIGLCLLMLQPPKR